MYAETERTLTAAEKQRLLASSPPVRSYSRTWGPYYLLDIVSLALSWTLIAWWRDPIAAAWFVAIFGPAYVAFLLVVSWGDLRDRRAAVVNRASLERQLSAASVVMVERVEAEQVVEIVCDEINLYLYNLGDGRWFVADDWDSSRGRRRRQGWPNSRFELIKVAGRDEEFGPFCEGRKLEPVESLDAGELDLDQLPTESRLYAGPLDSLRRRAAPDSG